MKMLRVCAVMLSALLVVSLASELFGQETSPQAAAAPPNEAKEWLKFLAGDWTREVQWWTEQDGKKVNKGRDIAELLANGRAVVVKYVGEDGSTNVCMLGWEPLQKAIVETGFNSDGFAWTITFDSIKSDELSGKNVVSSPDGSRLVGNALLRRHGDENYDVEIELKTLEGTEFKAKGTVKRNSPK